MKLKGKIALVTASTNGIGLAISKKLAAEGARVYLAARNKEKAEDIIKANPTLDLQFSYFDATDEESYRTCVTEVLEKEQRLDILVNNYGHTDVRADQDLLHTAWEDFNKIVEMNLKSVFVTSQEAIRAMQETGGSIINISSVGGLFPDVTRTAYGISKNAINFLTKQLAVQYADKKIRVNAVLPGYIETDAAKNNMSGEFLQAFLTTVPLGRPGHVEDLANAVLYFASDDSSFVTGQLLPVSGGFGVPSALYPLYRMQGKKG